MPWYGFAIFAIECYFLGLVLGFGAGRALS